MAEIRLLVMEVKCRYHDKDGVGRKVLWGEESKVGRDEKGRFMVRRPEVVG